ncbi:MAG TPA: D-cysteine desulfhydrase family protein [Steroidobacteraceae bacterium]|jgi:D-cysteine desulfhydrase/L-cysteate sulfo-lyase|nr:D-cysteine desulfhydrase family protein [Steroidobacteraceae bacterium]
MIRARSIIADLPRLRLAQLPTPLEDAHRLTKALGGPRILLKRDDLTGVGLGGNKVRKLEYVIGRAIAEGVDSLVVSGGFQSNLARIAAAIGNRLGLEVVLVLGGEPDEPRLPVGNLLLDRLHGVTIHTVDTSPRWDFGTAIEDVAEGLRRKGRHPFVVPLGGSGPEGMAGYVNATEELLNQLEELKQEPSRLYVAVGSGGTFSGLVLGALNQHASYQVIGISVSRTREYLLEQIPAAASGAAEALGLELRPTAEDLHMDDEYIGAGYGAMTEGCRDAISLVARTEGVMLDPVYSGKAMHGLIDHIRTGKIGSHETVIFLHTGGWPALFAYGAAALGVD